MGRILHVDTSDVRVMPEWAMQLLGTVMDVVAEFTGVMPLITSEMAQLLTKDAAGYAWATYCLPLDTSYVTSALNRFHSDKAVLELGYNASVPGSVLIEEMVLWQQSENLI